MGIGSSHFVAFRRVSTAMARSILWVFMATVVQELVAHVVQDDHHDHANDHDDHAHDHDDHDDHDCKWDHPWEWAGVFHVHHGGTLSWIAQKVGGNYADPTMKMVIISTTASSKAGLEAAEAEAETAWNGTFTTVSDGDTLSPNNAYTLTFDQSSWVTMFNLQVPAETELAVFCQHFPTEFVSSSGFSYLTAEDGKAMTTAYNISATACQDDHAEFTPNTDLIGEVVAAAFVVTLPSIFGILILVVFCKGGTQYAEAVMHYSNACASGVIFAVSVFLLMPESYLMMMGGKSESGAAAAWGSSVLGGWMIGIIVHQIAHLLQKRKNKNAPDSRENQYQVETGEKVLEHRVDWSHAIPVLWGDLIHNISDGMVLGFAFYACGSGFAWKLAGSMVAHEFPQEMADYYIFVNKAGLKWYVALALNFTEGMSAVLGAIVAYNMNVSSEVRGAFLAIGAGTFLYVASTELGPQVSETHRGARTPWLSTLGTVIMWLLGATVLALVLLDHEHCSIPADPNTPEEDLHNGHAHR